MANRFTLKDHFRESRLINGRLIFAAVVSALIFIVIVVRLVVLQVIEYEHFNSLSNRNRIDIEPLPPQRGLIYDRNGILLAENIPTFSLEMVPENVPDIEQTLADLHEILSLTEEDIEDFRERLKSHRRFQQIVIRQRLTEEEVARFSANRYRFPGIDVEGRLIRYYPQGNLFAHTVGYVGRINERELQTIDAQAYKGSQQIGKIGVEKEYEQVLHGKVGYRKVETNVQGRIVREILSVPPQSGKDIFLHLDVNLQRVAADALMDYNGSVIAMDPRNGAVLAMVSKPDYDPNKFVSGISNKDYAELRDSSEQPLFDRSLRGNYPPGSTLKPFVGLAGLELGVVTEDTHNYCPGWYSLPGHDHRYRCWKHSGHGSVDLKAAISQSCDVYFYDLANALGIDRLHGFLDLFGFGKRTGIDIPSEGSGLSPSREWKRINRNQVWYPGETLISGIGQGFNQTTPIQLAHATATLAMRGVAVAPQIVRATREAGSDKMQLQPKRNVHTLPMGNSQNWEAVIDSMVEVIHGRRGTARSVGEDMPFQVAGKTGTAQVFGIAQDEKYDAETLARKLHDHALFIAFAPADKPEFVVAVVMENGGSGSKMAAPVARKLILKHFGLDADEQPAE